MNTLIKLSLVLFCVSLLSSCSSTRHQIRKSYRTLSLHEKTIADSLLAYGLNHEALYTLMDTLKPVSSLKMYRFPLLSVSKSQRDSAIVKLKEIQMVAERMSNKEIYFVANPYKMADSVYKNVQLYAIRKERLQSIIKQHTDFYSKLGITENTSPEMVLSITENGNKYDRWRSYGYLFGYPDYAVDFFVEAGKSEDSTKQFVKRDFFAIPVYARETGYFTYAMPKEHKPGEMDYRIRDKARHTLSKYKVQRQKFIKDNQFKATKMWWKTLKNFSS